MTCSGTVQGYILVVQGYISSISGNLEIVFPRNPEFVVQRREIHRDVDHFCLSCSFEIT
jgi:hypothetical protein